MQLIPKFHLFLKRGCVDTFSHIEIKIYIFIETLLWASILLQCRWHIFIITLRNILWLSSISLLSDLFLRIQIFLTRCCTNSRCVLRHKYVYFIEPFVFFFNIYLLQIRTRKFSQLRAIDSNDSICRVYAGGERYIKTNFWARYLFVQDF